MITSVCIAVYNPFPTPNHRLSPQLRNGHFSDRCRGTDYEIYDADGEDEDDKETFPQGDGGISTFSRKKEARRGLLLVVIVPMRVVRAAVQGLWRRNGGGERRRRRQHGPFHQKTAATTRGTTSFPCPRRSRNRTALPSYSSIIVVVITKTPPPKAITH